MEMVGIIKPEVNEWILVFRLIPNYYRFDQLEVSRPASKHYLDIISFYLVIFPIKTV